MKKKTVPVLLNRRQLASELNFPLRRVYDAMENGVLVPDALDYKGAPLVAASRLSAARQALSKPEVAA